MINFDLQEAKKEKLHTVYVHQEISGTRESEVIPG